jgi:BlaI family penicillinase repressor
MAERKKGTIHNTEWDLLEVLWKKERATAREVGEALTKKRGWAVSTVKTLLDRITRPPFGRSMRAGRRGRSS